MRVGIVSEYVRPWPGGISEHVHHEALELVCLGHEVVVFSGPAHAAHVDSDCYRTVRLPWAPELISNGARSRVSLGPELLVACRFFARSKCDVLHVHAPLDPLLALVAVLGVDGPVVGTFHASFAPAPLWDVLYRAARPLTQAAFDRLSFRIAVSTEAERSIAHYFPGPYVQVPNGVALERFRAAAPDHAGRRILFVGRADPRKGLGLLLDAFALLVDENPRVELVLVGVARRELPARFRHHPRIEARGYVAPEDMPAQYRTANVVCAPSLYGESQGIVLLEAMAAGRPVVCFDIPGYREVVEDGVTGRVVYQRSAPALADALCSVLGDDTGCARALVAGPERARAFAWPAIGRRIERLLAQAAAGAAAS